LRRKIRECLFEDLDQAREISRQWLSSYNEERPHGAPMFRTFVGGSLIGSQAAASSGSGLSSVSIAR